MEQKPGITWVAHQLLPGDSTCATALASAAWSELPELQYQPCEGFLRGFTEAHEDSERVEFLAYNGPLLVGGGILVLEHDVHVGPCLSLAWQYVLPEYRHIGVVRRLHKVLVQSAKALNIPSIAYSHRIGTGEYITKYRRIHG